MTQAPRGKGPAIEPVIRIDSEVTRCVRQHARLHPKTEVCGVLIGDNENGAIEVRASIEGINAAQAGTHVTFTQDAWEAIYRVKDERYPDGRIVGWYHSHPGFGVFLSEHDMFIQENFFSSPGQIAWVYDPHTDEEGCFGWVDGKVHRIGALSIADNNGDGTERTPKHTESLQHDEVEDVETIRVSRPSRQPEPPRWARWAMTALSHLSVLVFGFAACYLLFPFTLDKPMSWWYVAARVPALMAPLVLLLPSEPIIGWRALAVAPMVLLSAVLPLRLAALYGDFSRRNLGFMQLVDQLPRGARTLVLARGLLAGGAEDSGDPSSSAPVYWHFLSWPMALKGGFSPNLFNQGIPVQPRGDVSWFSVGRTDRFEFRTYPDYDYYIVHESSDPLRVDHSVRIEERRPGDWILYKRVAQMTDEP